MITSKSFPSKSFVFYDIWCFGKLMWSLCWVCCFPTSSCIFCWNFITSGLFFEAPPKIRYSKIWLELLYRIWTICFTSTNIISIFWDSSLRIKSIKLTEYPPSNREAKAASLNILFQDQCCLICSKTEEPYSRA